MVKFSDVLLEIILIVIFFVTSISILVGTEYKFLFIIPLILYVLIHALLKRSKKIAKYVSDDFEQLGYKIVSERPVKLIETETKFEPALLIDNIPVSRFAYIREFVRVFTVTNASGEMYELKTSIRKNWTGKNSVIVKGKKLIQPNPTSSLSHR